MGDIQGELDIKKAVLRSFALAGLAFDKDYTGIEQTTKKWIRQFGPEYFY